HSGAFATPRQCLHKLSAMSAEFGQSVRTVLRLEICCLIRKRVAQPSAHFGIRSNREKTESAFAPFRRFVVSPFRPSILAASGQQRKTREQFFPDLSFNFVWIA